MPRKSKKSNAELAVEALSHAKARPAPPFELVLAALAPVQPWTRPMFGCVAGYVDEKIVRFRAAATRVAVKRFVAPDMRVEIEADALIVE